MYKRQCVLCCWVVLLSIVFLHCGCSNENNKVLRAGAAAIDITPHVFPVRVSGSFFERKTSEVKDRLHAKCVVFDNGQERWAIGVIDNCVTPRDIFDKAKQQASEATGIPMDKMLISANHTHSGPALDALLGSDGNMQYRGELPGMIAEAVIAAHANLVPARIGWIVIQDSERTYCRRWIRRPDRVGIDPFGYRTIRAMMHPGYQNPDFLGPSGPADPDISILSVQTAQGKPLALIANYSMHYVGAAPLSADYFGAFDDRLAKLMGDTVGRPPFVGIMTNGTSGDLHWMNYSQPKRAARRSHVQFGEDIANEVFEACKAIEYRDWVPFEMREKIISLGIRLISDEELQKARNHYETFKGRNPKTLPEVYAWEQVSLSDKPAIHEMKLQALNIGELGIATIPCEVFGITGLKIKAYSPLTPTFTIELANGYDGYIPTPAQHKLGGYTTWRARSACLEVEAEPKIAETLLGLLEEVSGKPLRTLMGEDYPFGDYPKAVLASKPVAYWRLNEFAGPQAVDTSGNGNHAAYDGGIAFYLEGAGAEYKGDVKRINRSPQCAGGQINANIKGLTNQYSVEMWFANYMPTDARDVTGYLFARCNGEAADAPCDHLALGGIGKGAGKLRFGDGNNLKAMVFGTTEIPLKTWHHAVLVRDGRKITVYLNGNPAAEITAEVKALLPFNAQRLSVGGRNGHDATFEGRVDEVAIYDRALTADEVARHYAAVTR